MCWQPPELAEPLNLAPIVGENPKTTGIHFEWKPVQDAVSYTLRISTTSMFTKAVKTATVNATEARKSAGLIPAIILERLRDGPEETLQRGQ